MTNATKVSRLAGFALISLLGVAGCEESRGATDLESTESEATGDEATAAQAVDPVMLELERVLRRVERGSSDRADAASLKKLAADEKLPMEAQDRASLGLSRVLEAAGETEDAVSAIEDLMKRHGGDSTFEAYDTATSRLRFLLSGSEEAPPTFTRSTEPVAPVARALVPFFAEDERGATLVDAVLVGRPPSPNDPNGVFNIGGAKRVIAEEECSVCDVDIKAMRSQSRMQSWVELPLHAGERRVDMPNPDRSMVVVYFDLTHNRVPSRYDTYLALSSEETIARLERGEAFVAARERPGKKPLVLLAAPRAGQLDKVEAAFARMTSLPTTPQTVDAGRNLMPHEIQGVVRSNFGAFRICYETLLKTQPAAAGKVSVKFRIEADGTATSVRTDSTIGDETLAACIADHFAKLRFPASADFTQVTYPIAFSPGD